ncbi:MAG: UDP-N-acetylmuramoyl-L-alanyl-D-glutamate--2,6-diaminopimelate ligase [Alphaproteobacteria bacterium]
MRLSVLTRAAGLPDPDRDLDVSGLAVDSRAVKPGDLFAALPGERADGRDFIASALAAGARAVLTAPGTGASLAGIVVETPNPRRALAQMAAAFYGRQPEHVAACTGTNGKSSTVTFARQIWTQLGFRAASLGTLGIQAPELDEAGSLTTPDPITLHHRLSGLVERNRVTHLAMEASSHGLDQFRMDGVRFSAAAFTNLARDHLDYHPTMEAYFQAKARLFTDLLPDGGAAVLNADIPEFERLHAIASARGHRLLDYGRRARALRLLDLTTVVAGQRATLEILGRRHEVVVPLIGAFQVENALAALGLVVGCGVDADKAVGCLARLTGVPGRLEPVGGIDGASVIVDYSHKPQALEAALAALRPHVDGRLIVVFGCGGDRDPGKRPMMGAVAARLADFVIVTDDNPRSEDPARIRRETMAGCPDAVEIGDRAEAIAAAIDMARAEDLVLIAGKGHESGQTAGGVTRPFDDRAVARQIIADRRGRRDGGR